MRDDARIGVKRLALRPSINRPVSARASSASVALVAGGVGFIHVSGILRTSR